MAKDEKKKESKRNFQAELKVTSPQILKIHWLRINRQYILMSFDFSDTHVYVCLRTKVCSSKPYLIHSRQNN